MAKYISNVSGVLTETQTAFTGGGGDANLIPNLDATGKLTMAMLPTGVGSDTAIVVASETIGGGALVNIWNNAGAFVVRNATAGSAGKEAHGYVLTGGAVGASLTVYFEGNNSSVTGLSPGKQYLATGATGTMTTTAPSVAGQVVQVVGFATSATSLNFQSLSPITLA